jgi:hypothetical protein
VKLFDRPWNQTAVEHPNIKRYSDWHEIANPDGSPFGRRFPVKNPD